MTDPLLYDTHSRMEFLVLQNPVRWIIFSHIIVGSMALAVLTIPLLSKKGGRVHMITGRIYVFAMIAVGISAMSITPWRAFFDPKRTTDSQGFAFFLFFVAVFTLCALSHGIAVLKQKTRKSPSRSIYHIGPPIALLCLGIITVFIGIHLRNILLMSFPIFAFLSAKHYLSYWLRAPKQKMHWWYEHMSGMITACIATITAFLVTALPRLWSNPLASSPIIWFAPGIILGFILNRWTQQFQLRFKEHQLD